jgi:hypothetical protein
MAPTTTARTGVGLSLARFAARFEFEILVLLFGSLIFVWVSTMVGRALSWACIFAWRAWRAWRSHRGPDPSPPPEHSPHPTLPDLPLVQSKKYASVFGDWLGDDLPGQKQYPH